MPGPDWKSPAVITAEYFALVKLGHLMAGILIWGCVVIFLSLYDFCLGPDRAAHVTGDPVTVLRATWSGGICTITNPSKTRNNILVALVTDLLLLGLAWMIIVVVAEALITMIDTSSVRKSGPMNWKKTGTGPDCNRWQPDRRLRFIQPEDFTGCGSSKFGIWVNRHRAGWDRSQLVFTTTATRRHQHRQPRPTTVRPQFRHPPCHLQHRHQHQVGPASTIAPPRDNPYDNLKTTTMLNCAEIPSGPSRAGTPMTRGDSIRKISVFLNST
ncbi:hypothetical protein EDB84DRAFT_1675853 [Lactarius hengduanensis]|nr:hypothetical protein EDB84DRAFT_1675853 [Lactarius hengduanensis]